MEVACALGWCYITWDWCIWFFRSIWIQPLNQSDIICSYEHILYAQRIATWCIILTNGQLRKEKQKQVFIHQTNYKLIILIKLSRYWYCQLKYIKTKVVLLYHMSSTDVFVRNCNIGGSMDAIVGLALLSMTCCFWSLV